MIKQLGKFRVNEFELAVRRLDHRSSGCNRIRIAVKGDDFGASLENGRGVAARSKCAVDNFLAGGVSFTFALVRHHSVSPSVADGQEMAVRSFRARDCISSNAAGSQS